MALGTSLPARIASVSPVQTKYISPSGSDASGTGDFASPWKTPAKAFDSIALTGGLILCRGGTYSISAQQTWQRSASSGNPVQIKNYPGETPLFTGAHMWLITGDYLRIGPGLRWSSPGGPDLIKVHWGGSSFASNIEVVGNYMENTGEGQSVSVQPSGATIGPVQIWDTEFVGGGSTDFDHHVYYAGGSAGGVIANCLFRDLPGGYGVQAYPNADGLIVTCCTFDNFTGRGPVVIGGDGSSASTGVICVGLIVCGGHGSSEGIDIVWEGSPGSATIYDSIGFDNSNGDFDAASGVSYVNCLTNTDPLFTNRAANDYTIDEDSPAYNLATARQAYVPVLDKTGAARTTADAGCFGTGGTAPPPDPGSAPSNTVAPIVTGTPEVGQTLSVTNGTWQGSGTIVFAREWQRNGVAIGGATGTTYVLVSADLNADIRVKVTASNAYGSADALSNEVGPIGGPTGGGSGAPVNTVQPTHSYSGTQLGDEITASPGEWDGDTPMTFAYQWRRYDAAGQNGADIGGATSSSYTLVQADVGKRHNVVVTASN